MAKKSVVLTQTHKGEDGSIEEQINTSTENQQSTSKIKKTKEDIKNNLEDDNEFIKAKKIHYQYDKNINNITSHIEERKKFKKDNNRDHTYDYSYDF
jgi:hypothetical protein